MSRLADLRARRRRLLNECERQRNELSARFSQLQAGPLSSAASELFSRGPDGQGTLLRPLTWALALAGLLFLRRPRQVMTVLAWVRAAVSLASRASLGLRLLGQLRAFTGGGGGERVRGRTRRTRAAEH